MYFNIVIFDLEATSEELGMTICPFELGKIILDKSLSTRFWSGC